MHSNHIYFPINILHVTLNYQEGSGVLVAAGGRGHHDPGYPGDDAAVGAPQTRVHHPGEGPRPSGQTVLNDL